MAFENKTVDSVYTLLIESFQEKFNSEFRLLPKSFIVVLSKVLAGIFVIPYKLCGWFYLQLFADTASYEYVTILGHELRPLVMLGNLYGVGEPISGNAWEGTITVTAVTTGKTITQGTQLKSDVTGLVYCVSENTSVDDDEVSVPIYCTVRGTDGDLDDGDSIKFVSPLGFVQQEAVVESTTTAGTDDETEAHYRSRVREGYGAQPQGGALADYRAWANSVSGVLQSYIYNDSESAAGVLIYVAGTTDVYADRVPDSSLLVAVGEACTYDPDTGEANRKPMGAVLDPDGDETYANVMAVSIVTVDVYITDMSGAETADFGSAAKSELETFFLNREPYIRGLTDETARTDGITKNGVISVVNGVAVALQATFGSATMQIDSEEVTSYSLGQGELAALGTLYINGTAYEE